MKIQFFKGSTILTRLLQMTRSIFEMFGKKKNQSLKKLVEQKNKLFKKYITMEEQCYRCQHFSTQGKYFAVDDSIYFRCESCTEDLISGVLKSVGFTTPL